MANNAKSLSSEKARKIFQKLGIKEASPDHPVYTEQTSIRFLNHAMNNAAKRRSRRARKW